MRHLPKVPESFLQLSHCQIRSTSSIVSLRGDHRDSLSSMPIIELLVSHHDERALNKRTVRYNALCLQHDHHHQADRHDHAVNRQMRVPMESKREFLHKNKGQLLPSLELIFSWLLPQKKMIQV